MAPPSSARLAVVFTLSVLGFLFLIQNGLAVAFFSYSPVSSFPNPSKISHPPPEDTSEFQVPFFAPSAIISLTSDNATFFLARPAAFGPDLPEQGISATLWVGRGFGHEFGCDKETDGDGDEDDENSDRDTQALLHVRAHNRRQSSGAEGDPALPNPEIANSFVLLARGRCSFLDKVRWADAQNALAVIVGDVYPNRPLVTMYSREGESKANVSIPAVFTGFTTAQVLSRLSEASSKPPIMAHSPHHHHNYPSPSPYSVRITLTPAAISPSPILDTILVLVVSPLVTLSIVYSLLLARSRLRRRRWRAPKSLVAQLPVRTYRAVPSSRASSGDERDLERNDSDGGGRHAERQATESTPLLSSLRGQQTRQTDQISVSALSSSDGGSYRSGSVSADSLSSRYMSDQMSLGGSYDIYSLSRSAQSPGSVHSVGSFLRSNSGRAGSISGGAGIDAVVNSHDSMAAATVGASESRKKHSALSKSRQDRQRQRRWKKKYGARQKDCVVCQEEYLDGVSRVMRLPCGHEFHEECITPWLTTRRRTCPMCNNDVVRATARQKRRRERLAQKQQEQERERENVKEEKISGATPGRSDRSGKGNRNGEDPDPGPSIRNDFPPEPSSSK